MDTAFFTTSSCNLQSVGITYDKTSPVMQLFSSTPHQKWTIFLCLSFIFLPHVTPYGFVKRVNFQPTYMTPDEVIEYFRSFLTRVSTHDLTNEEFYMTETFPEDLQSRIDNLMPTPLYLRWLMKTRAITDSPTQSGYLQNLNALCAPSSVFNQSVSNILKTWDGDTTVAANEIEQWHRDNENVRAMEICNRFRGLTCQYKRALAPDVDQGKQQIPTKNATCQCSGDPINIGYYKAPIIIAKDHDHAAELHSQRYLDGCFVRPWRPCKHVSAVDSIHKDAYKEWHGSLENERRILAQIVFPVGRTHRCKQGTYCMDLIPGMKKPICWCNQHNEHDKECVDSQKNTTKHKVPPLGSMELMHLRRDFLKLIIPAEQTKRSCSPEFNEDIRQLTQIISDDPSKTGSVTLMKKIMFSEEHEVRICDFRQALLCDMKTRTCVGNLNCGPGKVHLGKGVCAINNGFQCQSNEDCVVNSRCKYMKQVQESACICETGYGDKCLMQNKPFFGSRFLPVVSGFRENEYIKMQSEILKALESWEDSMSLKYLDKCDPGLDKDALEIIEYFGNLEKYDKVKGEDMLMRARRLSRDGAGLMCKYKNFLHCSPAQSRCVPILGKRMMHNPGDFDVMIELAVEQECEPEIPKIFMENVRFTCPKGFSCQQKGANKYCMQDCKGPNPPKSCKDRDDIKRKAVYMTHDWDNMEARAEPLDWREEGPSEEEEEDAIVQKKTKVSLKPPPPAHCDGKTGGDPSDQACHGVNCVANPEDEKCKPTCRFDPTQNFCPPDCHNIPEDERCKAEARASVVGGQSQAGTSTTEMESSTEMSTTDMSNTESTIGSVTTETTIATTANTETTVAMTANTETTITPNCPDPSNPLCPPPGPNCPDPNNPLCPPPPGPSCPDPNNPLCPPPPGPNCPDPSNPLCPPPPGPSCPDPNNPLCPPPPGPSCPDPNNPLCPPPPGPSCPDPNNPSCPPPPGPDPDCPDPNNPSCPPPPGPDCNIDPTDPQCPPPEPSTPAPEPPSRSLKYLEPCDMKDDKCDRSFYLICVGSKTDLERSGQYACQCMPGLWPTDNGKSACGIPYDEVCGADAVSKLEEHLKTPLGLNAPKCFDGECSEINGNYFCRPGEHEFPMFVTQQRLKKFEGQFRKGGKGRAGNPDDSDVSEEEKTNSANNLNQLKTFSINYITGLSLIFTFFRTTRKFI